MKKKKVLFICPSLCHGGIEQFQIAMLKMLDDKFYDLTLYLYLNDTTLLPLVPEHVKVIIDKDQNHYFRKPKAIWFGLKKILFKSKKYEEQLRAYVHNQKMIHPAKDVFNNEKFDVVIANVIGRGTEMALHIKADKRYVFFHSSLDLHHDLMEQLFPQYDGIVAVSSGVQDMLKKAYPNVKEKICVLENWVDAEDVIEKSKDNSMKEQVKKEVVTLVSCGRLSKEKGFDIAVETAKILKYKGFNYHWFFVGDGAEREKIENMIKEDALEEYISITGYMENPYPIIKNCDIYVQPSYEESYGRTIKEAIILGCPVVSTATVGGCLLIKNKENGIITEISSEALAIGIVEMIENLELQNKCKEYYRLEQNEIEKQVFKDSLEKILS